MNLVDGLPRDSRFVEAVADDEDLARAALDHDSSESEFVAGPRLSEWSPERDELAVIADLLGALVSLTAQVHGGKARIRPRPRPSTALERVRREKRWAQHRELVAFLKGEGNG